MLLLFIFSKKLITIPYKQNKLFNVMKMYTTPFSSSLHHRVAQLFIASAIMSIAPTPFFSQKTYAQTTAQSVSGTVIDKNNETLVGAIIKVLPNGDMTQNRC